MIDSLIAHVTDVEIMGASFFILDVNLPDQMVLLFFFFKRP